MTRIRLTFLVGGVLMLGATMCQYAPQPKSGDMLCADKGQRCPDGFECSLVDLKCYRPDDLPLSPPSTGGSTTVVTVSTGGAAGATGGTSSATSSKTVPTGGQVGGTTTTIISTSTAAGGVAGSTPKTTLGGSSSAGGAGGASTNIVGGTGGGSSTAVIGGVTTGGTVGGSATTGGVTTGGIATGVSKTGGVTTGGTTAAIAGTPAAGTTAAGGAGGTSTTSAPTTAAVTFKNGKAVGPVSGWGWIAFAPKDTVTDPLCGSERLVAGVPCNMQVWSTTDSLCVSGSIPAVDPQNPDFDNNWGISIGVNTSEVNGGTLGQAFSSISFSLTGLPQSGLRSLVHRKGDPTSVNYCAEIVPGKVMPFTAFSTTCYDTLNPGTALTAADVPNLENITVQIPSVFSDITVSNLCLTGMVLGK